MSLNNIFQGKYQNQGKSKLEIKKKKKLKKIVLEIDKSDYDVS